MAEPEFVLHDVPADEGHSPLTSLKRAGRRRAVETVLVDLDAHPGRRRFVTRLAFLLVIGGGVAAAVVVYRRRRPGGRDESPLRAPEGSDIDELTAPLGSRSSNAF
jgi:hypothetical protein